MKTAGILMFVLLLNGSLLRAGETSAPIPSAHPSQKQFAHYGYREKEAGGKTINPKRNANRDSGKGGMSRIAAFIDPLGLFAAFEQAPTAGAIT